MTSLVAIVTILSVLVYFWTGMGVARARRVSGVDAPTMTGHPTLERAVRVQANALEWMPIYLPLLWLNVAFPPLGSWTADAVAAVGLVWIVGRLLYAAGYMADPAKRSAGFLTQAIACIVLLIGAFTGSVMRLLAGG